MTVGSDGSASETQDKWRALSGNLTIGTTAYSGSDSINIYNEYYKTYPDLNIDFENESSKIFNVNILNGDGSILWTRKIRNDDSITEEFLNGGPDGAFDISKVIKGNTRAETFTFANKWQIKDGAIIDQEMPIPDVAITADITIEPIFNSAPRYYSVIFKNYNDEIIADFSGENKVPYGTKLMQDCYPHGITPIKSLNTDKLYSAWRFLGYSTNRNASQAMRFSDDAIVDNDMTYYAIYNFINDVRTKATDNKYFRFEEYNYTKNNENINGYIINANLNLLPTGKITIPAKYNNKPVLGIGIEGFKQATGVTHVFFEGNENHPLRLIGQKAFQKCSNLKYVDFDALSKLYIIEQEAFQAVKNLSENTSVGKTVVIIEYHAFNQAFNYGSVENIVFTVPGSVEILGYRAISYNEINKGTIKIGTNDNPSRLDIERSLLYDSRYFQGSGGTIIEAYLRSGIVQNLQQKWANFYAIRGANGAWSETDTYTITIKGIPYETTVADFFGFNWNHARPNNISFL